MKLKEFLDSLTHQEKLGNFTFYREEKEYDYYFRLSKFPMFESNKRYLKFFFTLENLLEEMPAKENYPELYYENILKPSYEKRELYLNSKISKIVKEKVGLRVDYHILIDM